jgi:hypothetical protein
VIFKSDKTALGDGLTSGGKLVKIGPPGMTFLPIVERELRVAARRRGTYGMRMKIAGAATVAFAACFIASLINPAVSFVQILFWGLSGLSMLFCLAAGRLMTADCLSQEKREGTLGLLFLTDLKGYDVVVGKLAATSLGGFYGLIAVFPMLAIPLLAGGMTSGEFWRMVVVLVNTFLFSLAVGLLVSAECRDEQKAMGANFALLLCLAVVPHGYTLLLNHWMSWPVPPHKGLYSCPLYSFWLCADVRYKVASNDFWWSIGVTFGLTLLLLLLACWTAPRSWQDKPVLARSRRRKGERRRRWWREGSVQGANAFRKRLLDLNSYLWLAARPPLKVSYVWAAVGLTGCLWVFTAVRVRNVEEEANVVFALLLNLMLKLWIATEAGRQLAEDKRSGAFELLLSTPLTVRDIVRGQRLALRRQFLKPLAVAVIVELILMVSIRHPQDAALATCLWLAGILMLVADAITLGWVGMLAALTAKNHGRATIKTAASVLVLPWFLAAALNLAILLFRFLFVRQSWDIGWRFDLGCWFGVGIFLDLLLTLKARRRLQRNFRQLALEPHAPRRRLAWLRDWRMGTPERKEALRAQLRRLASVGAALLAVVAVLTLYDIHAARANFPKPLVISLSQSNHPARVFAPQEWSRTGFLFILPDGTLWTWGRQVAIAPPQRVGTNRDWVQVSVYENTVGLRSNGTLWTWAVDSDKPKQFGTDHDWVEAGAGNGSSFARKRDGSLWGWGNNNQNQLGIGPGPSRPEGVRIGTNLDWKAVSTASFFGLEVLALRADGTLWTWGNISYFTNSSWKSTNYPQPVQLCQESNWAGFGANLENGARNQAGESWCLIPPTGLPGAQTPIAAIGQLLSSNAATIGFGPLFTTNWNYAKYELRTNGSLWATPWSWPPASAPLAPPIRVGQRSDWVSVWGSHKSMIGMTTDGTLWTWGLDYGQKSRWTQVLVERLGVIKEIVGFIFGGSPPSYSDYFSQEYPAQKEPRPLLRLAATNSVPGRQ